MMDRTAKERMKRYRNKDRNKTPTVTGSVTQYPAIVYALVNNRNKLKGIYHSLKGHNLLKEVSYGYGGPTFDIIGEMLELSQPATRKG